MVVGDDVALGIDDETGTKRLAHLVAAVIALVGVLAAEKVVEKVLEALAALAAVVLIVLTIVPVGVLLLRAPVGEVLAVQGLLGQCLGVDIDDSRTHFFGDLDKGVRRNAGVDDLERRGVGTGVLLLLAADSVRGIGTCHDPGGQDPQQDESRRETARPQPFEEQFHEFPQPRQSGSVPMTNPKYSDRGRLSY